MIHHVRARGLIVLCVTNHVVMNYTANILLACGVSPIMSLETSDLRDLSKICSSMLINIGTLDHNIIDLCFDAINFGIAEKMPIVFDPVGSGASEIRTKISRKIAQIDYDKLIIKGNASEILSLFSDTKTSGTDSIHSSDDVIEFAKNVGKVICITGKNDYIIHGQTLIKVMNGSDKLQQITGTGCALGGLIAAYAAVDFSASNIANAISFFGIASEIADRVPNKGIGTFGTAFLDALSVLDQKVFELKKNIVML